MAQLAIVKTDGTYAGAGQFTYVSRFLAFAAATAVALALFFLLATLSRAATGRDLKAWKKWLMGMFLGEDGECSLSMFQILLWTIVTVWSLLFVFFNTGNLLAMTQQVMVLLGFAGAGSLAARWASAGRPPAQQKVEEPRFWAMLETGRRLDLFKVQLFLFTVLIAAYVVFRVVRQSAFPVIEAEFLLLMGVSNGLYVGSKFGPSTPYALAETRKFEWDNTKIRVEELEREIAILEGKSKELDGKINAQPPRAPATKNDLIEQKKLVDGQIEEARKQLAQAHLDRDAKAAAYKEALAALPAT